MMLLYPEMKGKMKKLQKEKSRIMWNDELDPAFKTFEQCLVLTGKKRLQYYERGLGLILVTGASDKYHSVKIFQANPEGRSDDLLKRWFTQ
eukprot:snap_masked-scaffold_101-processed-gene-0.33-mRNA-1 protein AED:1.00 eAED:1.00 QI:0/-1/0/0/-1/1/1/0/90